MFRRTRRPAHIQEPRPVRHLGRRRTRARNRAASVGITLAVALGAGTLAANREWVEGEEFFLACYADNLTDFDLRSLINAHRASGLAATLTVFHSANPSAGGVVEVDGTGRVTGFTEKPSEPVSDLANAGMYAFHPSVLDEIGGTPPADIGYDLLPRLVGRAHAVPVEGYFRDIGTIESYRRAREEWPARALR